MTLGYPIPRQDRQSDIFVGDGTATYGPFDFKIFSVDDVEVWTKAVGDEGFVLQPSVIVAKTSGLAFDSFFVTFPATQPATTRIVVQSARVDDRSAGVMAGTRIDPNALEKELSKISTEMQEVRRDLGRGLKTDFGQIGLTLDLNVADGDTIMKSGNRLVRGANAADIIAAQGYAVAADASADRAEAAAEAAEGAPPFDASLAMVLPLGAGGILRSVIQVLQDIPPSIAWYGAVPGASNLEAKIEAALAANKAVSIPNGEYEFTRTVQSPQPGNKIFGQSELSTRLMRSGDWDGPTFRFGKGDNTAQAGDCTVQRVWMEQRKQAGFVTGQQTMLSSTKQTKGQSHIEVWGGVHANLNEIRFHHGQFGISCWGTVHSKFSDIHSHGSWDNKNPAVSEALATIRLAENQSIPSFRYNTEIRIERSYIGTGGPSPDRTFTIGDVSYAGYENVGPQFGILVQGCEGLEILNGYIGGCGQSDIAFQPFGMIREVLIDGMFLDECYKAWVEHLPFAGGAVTSLVLGSGNRANSQLKTQHGLYIPQTGANPSVYGLSVAGGNYLNLLRTPFFLGGVAGGVISPKLIAAYNSKMSTISDPAVQAGAYVHGASRDIFFDGGLYGGGINDWGAANGAKWGPYNAGRPNIIAGNVNAILGMPGGTRVGGMTQTYPTT